MSDETPRVERVTVSRDALRADLAEMELRLRTYIEQLMAHKADVTVVLELARKVADLDVARQSLDRGEFTEAQRLSIAEEVRAATKDAKDSTWTNRERVQGVLSLCVTATMLVLSIVLALHGVTLP